MSKKRGVVVSTADNTKAISKSKSAQVNPLNPDVYNHSLNKCGPNDATRSLGLQAMDKVQLSESNLLSSEPQCMINQAYYTYQDPDYGGNYDANNNEQNEDYFIESMHKKKEIQQQHRKHQEKQKQMERFGKSTGTSSKEKRLLKNKQTQKNKIDRLCKQGLSPKNQRTKNYNEKEINHKCRKIQKHAGQVKNQQINLKKELNSARFKPKPLHFDVDILQKLPMQPANKRKTETLSNIKTSFRTRNELYAPSADNLESEQQAKYGQNRNSRKMPFRFKGAI